MDKRKLKLKTSLHKNLQDNQFSQLEKLESVISDKRQSFATNLSATSTISLTMERSDSFIDGKLSNIRSSVLKPLNSQSITGTNSSMKSKKRNFCEIKNDTSEEEEEEEEKEEDWITSRELSRTIVSKSRQNSQVSINTSVISPKNIRFPGNNKSPIKRHPKKSRTVDSRITEEVSKEAEKSDSNSSFNVSTVIKRKCETIQNINTNDDPFKKDCMVYKSPVKSIAKSNIFQKKQHDKSRELYSSTRSEKHRSNNEEDHLLGKWQNVASIFSNFLQKCGITLSINDIPILSKYFYVLYFTQKEYTQ